MKKNQKSIFNGTETPAERLQILKDNCEQTEQFTYAKELSEEELTVAKDKYAQNGIKFNQINEELEELKKEYKAKLLPIQTENKMLLGEIAHGARTVNENVFLFADQETGMMEYYNELGDVVYSRKLMPQERQTRIMSLKKTGTNDK